MRLFIAALALLVGLTTANAQIAGQDDPQFKAALAQWLDGQDLVALTALSKLAKADNRAAQVFLGRVDSMRHTHIHVTNDMDRKTRNKLMRAKGSVLGKNWLRVAEVDTPLATAFLNANIVRQELGAIVQLLQFNEGAAATAALVDSFGEIRGDDFVAINEALEYATLPPHIPNFFHSVDDFWAKRDGSLRISQTMAATLSTRQLVQQDAFNWPPNPSFGQIDLIVSGNPIFAPFQNFCVEKCGGNAQKCMRALYQHQIWQRFHSPTETLLSNAQYFTSPRMSGDLKRGLVLLNPALKQIKQYDQCTYDAVIAE